MRKKPGKYKIQGRLSEFIYATANTLRGAKAKRKKVARTHFMDKSNLDIVGPTGNVILRGNRA